MKQNLTYDIISNQHGIHPRLLETLTKHAKKPYLAPISEHSKNAFICLCDHLSPQQALILDSGCGTGMSTDILAKAHPEHIVIGVDKSWHRLNRHHDTDPIFIEGNKIILRADLIDFWRLCKKANWRFEQHYIFYPNPWPKAKHLMRRFYAHPVFSDMLSLSQHLVIRSNWPLYLEECAIAITALSKKGAKVHQIQPEQPVSLFEKKYLNSGQNLFELEFISK